MPVGDPYAIDARAAVAPLSGPQRADLERVVQQARTISGFGYGVYLGPLPAGRASALEKHALLPDPASAVLVAVDPAQRLIEIVTGANTTAALDDHSCELAVLTMRSCFVNGDLVGGVREGVLMLAQRARHPRVLNLDEPA